MVFPLNNVYAVETRPGFYLPRSKAMMTADSPKLWVDPKDALRAMNRHKVGHRDKPSAFPRIVAFKLERMAEFTEEEASKL